MPTNKSASAIAGELLKNGYAPVCIPAGQKGPNFKGWQKHSFTADDFPELANVGIRCGDGCVAFLDVDIFCADQVEAIKAEWKKRFDRRGALMQRTGRAPKTGFVFRTDEPIKKRKQAVRSSGKAPLDKNGKPTGEAVEVLGEGQQFVAFGIHPDTQQPYRWEDLDPTDNFLVPSKCLPEVTIAEVDDFLAWVKTNYGPVEAQQSLTARASVAYKADMPRLPDGAVSEAEAREILGYIPADDYDQWLRVLMGLHSLGDHMLGIANEWSLKSSKYTQGCVDEKWRSFTRGEGVSWSTVCHEARLNSADLSAIARKHSAGSSGRSHDLPAISAPTGLTTDREEPVVDTKGRPQWCYQTAYAMILGHEVWADVLAFDEFVGVVMLCKPIPGTKTPRSSFKPRELADTDISHAVRWFNQNGFPRATKTVVTDALIACATENIISPVRHYLEDLSWDGTQRVQTWLTAYAGAPDAAFNQAVGKAWLISAVARALDPGCKADCALILEGSQGVGKSSLLRVLAGSDWFHDGLGDLSNKDAAVALRGKWVIELPELAAMRRTDVESTKAFLSRTTERFRPPYGRVEVVEPRRCVFAGTTNRKDWLADDTGGRRFWPVTVADVRLEQLKQDRDQIWAEAVQLYKAGEKWWLEGDIELTASAIVGERGVDDTWTTTVLDYCRGRSEVSTKEILGYLSINLSDQTKADAMRVAGILTRNGWEKDGQFKRGDSKGLTRYVQRGGAGGF